MPIQHVVREGESTTSLSERYGFAAKTIWEDPGNDGLRAHRRNMNTLLPGDVLTIPDKRLREVACATGAVHRFRRRGIPAKYRLRVLWKGRAAADKPYVLTVDGAPMSGRTTSDGVVEQWVPAGAKRGTLVVHVSPKKKLRFALAFGRLHPIEEPSGVAQRLSNLGYRPERDRDPPGELSARAVKRFQADHGLDATGEVDDATRVALHEAHDRRDGSPAGEG